MSVSVPPGIPGPDAAREPSRLAELVTDALSLRNDLRDILTPALLAADMLLKHADPTVVKRAETMVKAVTRAVKRTGVVPV